MPNVLWTLLSTKGLTEKCIYLLGIYYIVMMVRGVYNGNLEEADNSIAIVYMVLMLFVWNLV